jgi:rare lipoprotein A
MKNKVVVLVFLFTTFLWGQQFPKYLYGVASWYGQELTGKKTASGEIYNPQSLTAAHRTLPFGSVVEVENLENGKKVEVVINDRGPFVDNRIIDVSQKAAEELGFLQKGTAYVKVTIIRLGNETNNTSSFSLSPNTNQRAFPSPTDEKKVVTNYITNTQVITNYITSTNSPQALIIPYEEKTVETPKPNPSFILDEPEEIFVPAITTNKTAPSQPLPPREDVPAPKTTNTSSSEPQIIFTDVLLPEEKVIPLETRPLTNNIPTKSSQPVQEELRVTGNDVLQAGEKYVVQVGAFTRQDNAIKLYQQLRNMGLPAFTSETVVNNTRFIRVRVGYYTSREEAQKVINKLYSQKLNPLLLKVKP